MFVRDPFERAVSSYYNKVIEENYLNGQNWTIREYFNNLVKNDYKDQHIKPQIAVCDPCFLNITYLGRTETLLTDLDAIINKETKLHLQIPFSLNDQKNSTVSLKKTKNKPMLDIYRQLDRDLIKKFIWKYRLDYIAFGYDPYKILSKLPS